MKNYIKIYVKKYEMSQYIKIELSVKNDVIKLDLKILNRYEIVEICETNGLNNYYILLDTIKNSKYVVMHIVNGKFAIYDYIYHNIIKEFKWYPNNGNACTILEQIHIDKYPDLLKLFELKTQLMMHVLIKVYLLKEPKIITNKHDDFRIVLHHINGKCRDNRVENLMWIGKYEQLSIFKTGKLNKTPIEVRYLSEELPKYVKWINAKRCYRIDEHPVIYVMVKNKEIKHKYICSLIGKKSTALQKYNDVMKKYKVLQQTPYYDNDTYQSFLDKMNRLEKENVDIINNVKGFFVGFL